MTGNTTATFTPATGNGYYFITEDTPLYLDAACTQRARGPLSASTTYYYSHSWYELEGGLGNEELECGLLPRQRCRGNHGCHHDR